MPLCIAGMHRSGTSMIASLLYHCGLYLGTEKDMLLPAADNPEGFWEHRSFVKLNDSILKELGGSWDRPPRTVLAGCEVEPALHRLRNRAVKLARQFRGREPWGWKDPRNCLTLSFWRSLLPKMNVLICVRNPLAVAKSLRDREGMSLTDSFDLWLTYNRRILESAPPERRLIALCESFFHAPQVELGRVLTRFGIAVSEERFKRACARIKPSLVHHRGTMNELIAEGASDELVRCYLDLCAEADAARFIAATAA
jgi:hypothetical protein